MKIGPVDIRTHGFVKRGMRGLDEAEVRAYLELVADRLEEAILEAEDLHSRIDGLHKQVEAYRSLEQSLRDSLLSAGRMADDRLAQAEKEAQILIKDAEVEGEKILLRSRQESARLQAAIDDLRRQRTTYVERFRALLRSQMKILEASVAGFDPENVEGEPLDVTPASAREATSRVASAPPAAATFPPPSARPAPAALAPPPGTPFAAPASAPTAPWGAPPSATRPFAGSSPLAPPPPRPAAAPGPPGGGPSPSPAPSSAPSLFTPPPHVPPPAPASDPPLGQQLDELGLHPAARREIDRPGEA